jgi:hypothetical protein
MRNSRLAHDRTTISKNSSKPNHFFLVMKPILVLVTIATVFIAGSIFSPLLFLLSSSEIAYSQTPDQALSAPSQSGQQPTGSAPTFTPPSPSATSPLGQTPDQALSSPTTPSSPAAPSSPNPSTSQQGEQEPQPPGSEQSAIPGLLSPPEQSQQQLPTSQQQLPPLSPPTQPIPSQQEQPPSIAPLTQTTANGTIDSLIFAPGTRWIATGNWSMVIRNDNVNSFSTNMTWYNNNGTGTHTHELLNFRSSGPQITEKPGDNILLKGLMDVGTNHRIIWTNVNSIVDIKGGKTIAISLDDKQTNNHFAGQTIYGVVKSFTRCSDIPGQNMEVLEPCSSPPPSISSSSPSS